MKIEFNDEKIIIYLYEFYFDTLDKNNLIKNIKKIFLKLMIYYDIKLLGLYNVSIFENIKYGTVLEIDKEKLLFPRNMIDINVKIFKNQEFYLKTNDYFSIENYNNIYYYKDNYYINIKNIDNIYKVLEHVKIIYNKKDNYLNNMLFIK